MAAWKKWLLEDDLNTFPIPSSSRAVSYPVPTATSSWVGLESILADLMDHFHVGRDLALEFG